MEGGSQLTLETLAARGHDQKLVHSAAPVSPAGLDGYAPLTERATLVFKAATAGDISVEAATALITALSGLSRLAEADDLTARVALLEARYGA